MRSWKMQSHNHELEIIQKSSKFCTDCLFLNSNFSASQIFFEFILLKKYFYLIMKFLISSILFKKKCASLDEGRINFYEKSLMLRHIKARKVSPKQTLILIK